jgi:hypothetical protein
MAAKFTIDRKLRKELREMADKVGRMDQLYVVVYAGRTHLFKRICRRIQAFACTSLGIVVKRPNLIITTNTPLKYRVPTIKLNAARWVVQPIVDTSEAARAEQVMERKLKGWFCDLHTGNVGFWKNKAVMFDW